MKDTIIQIEKKYNLTLHETNEFEKGCIQFFKRAGFLTEKQIYRLKVGKPVYYYCPSNEMMEFDRDFRSAFDY